MKLSKFAEFFGARIISRYGCDKKDGLYRFEVIDRNGKTRRIIFGQYITCCFNEDVKDYIFRTLEYHGFDLDKEGINYIKARKFIAGNEALKDTELKEVVDCMCDADLIEDDISDYEAIRHDARALLVEWFSNLWLSDSHTIIFDIQHELNMNLDEIIDTIVKGCEADGEYSENDAELSIGAMESICELEATLYQQTNFREETIEVFSHMVHEAAKYNKEDAA